jgi:hypothetical protein
LPNENSVAIKKPPVAAKEATTELSGRQGGKPPVAAKGAKKETRPTAKDVIVMSIIRKHCLVDNNGESRWVSARRIIELVLANNVERKYPDHRQVRVNDMVDIFKRILVKRSTNGTDCRFCDTGGEDEVQWTQVKQDTRLQTENQTTTIQGREPSERKQLEKACTDVVNEFKRVHSHEEAPLAPQYSDVEDAGIKTVARNLEPTPSLNDGINVAMSLLLSNKGMGFSTQEIMNAVKAKFSRMKQAGMNSVASHVFNLAENHVGVVKQGDVVYYDSDGTMVMIKK